jgi:hypothetical protein
MDSKLDMCAHSTTAGIPIAPGIGKRLRSDLAFACGDARRSAGVRLLAGVDAEARGDLLEAVEALAQIVLELTGIGRAQLEAEAVQLGRQRVAELARLVIREIEPQHAFKVTTRRAQTRVSWQVSHTNHNPKPAFWAVVDF